MALYLGTLLTYWEVDKRRAAEENVYGDALVSSRRPWEHLCPVARGQSLPCGTGAPTGVVQDSSSELLRGQPPVPGSEQPFNGAAWFWLGYHLQRSLYIIKSMMSNMWII